ncbi:MAG: ATP synthase subunit I [Gammaproteobacteria bacterium]
MTGTEQIKKNRFAAYRIVILQLLLTAIIASLMFFCRGVEYAWSALAGGIAYVGPHACFIRYAFRDPVEFPGTIIGWFYLGEAWKFILSGMVFAFSFAFIKPLSVVTLFTTFIVMMVFNLAGMALLGKDIKRNLAIEKK